MASERIVALTNPVQHFHVVSGQISDAAACLIVAAQVHDFLAEWMYCRVRHMCPRDAKIFYASRIMHSQILICEG